MPEQTVQIGTLILTEPTVFRQLYDCAAWFSDIEVPAGSYPIFAEVRDNGEVVDFPGPRAKLVGKVVADDFSPLYAGVPVADGSNKYVGEEAEYCWSNYAHALAWSLIRDKFSGPIRVELLPEFKAVIHNFTFDGQQRQTAGIVRVADSK